MKWMYKQQKGMEIKQIHQCAINIINVFQPHVGLIVRKKAEKLLKAGMYNVPGGDVHTFKAAEFYLCIALKDKIRKHLIFNSL